MKCHLSYPVKERFVPQLTKLSDFPLEITDLRVKFNSIGTPEVFLAVKNISDSITVDAFTFEAKCYDAYDALLQAYGFGDTVSSYIWQEGKIAPGKTWSDSKWRWGLYGYDTVYRLEIRLVSVHTTTGHTIKVSEDSQNTWTWKKYN